MSIIAFDFAHRIKKQYNENTFSVFEKWLEKYVRGWGDCDDFCTHAFGELIAQKPELVSRTISWTKRKEFWMRRAAAVILISLIRQKKYNESDIFQISDILMNDKHKLVISGYKWILREFSQKEPELVFDYLMKNKDVMPKYAYRYAMQKLCDEKKRVLLQ